MDKTCPEHKEYHTGCIPCQHDCIEENDELKFKVEQLEAQIEQMKKDYPFFDDADCGDYTLEDGKPLEK